MIRLIGILKESILMEGEPSKTVLQDCKALFTSYVNTTNNKSSLERLYKKKNDPFLKRVLSGQKFSNKPMYRGITNWKGTEYKIGQDIKFGFEGWSTDKKTAMQFTGGSNASAGKGVIFVMNKPSGQFIDIMKFGQSLQNEIERLRPKFDFTNPDLTKVYKAADKDPIIKVLHELYQIAQTGKYGRGESETVTEPQTLKITKLQSDNPMIIYLEK